MVVASPSSLPVLSAVDRRFEAIMFDWDGTAVPDRHSDARDLRVLIESLCAYGMHLCVVTGTHVHNVDDQLRSRPGGPGRLLLAVNRGSEVYEVDGDGPRLLHRRQAADAENHALDRAAALTIERLSRRGLAAELVSQRLNRRKIDLIPVPEWSDPPKSQIDRLLAAVEARLAAAGLGGVPEAVEIAQQAAFDAGLDDPRVTSDAKHVEIGLTDKSDAARDFVARLWREEGIGPSLLLIAGDELGPLGRLPGSDSFMLIPEARDAVSVSVGVEPTGVPPAVTHLGGGPARFGELLSDQLERRVKGDVPDVHLDAGWSLTFPTIEHERERAVETLLTLADGTIGTSGAPLLTHPSAAPGVVVAGLYQGEGPPADLLEAPRWERLRPASAADEDVGVGSTSTAVFSPSASLTVGSCEACASRRWRAPAPPCCASRRSRRSTRGRHCSERTPTRSRGRSKTLSGRLRAEHAAPSPSRRPRRLAATVISSALPCTHPSGSRRRRRMPRWNGSPRRVLPGSRRCSANTDARGRPAGMPQTCASTATSTCSSPSGLRCST